MKIYPLYFLPLVLIVVLIHLLLRKPIRKEIIFPPLHLLRRIYIRYMWRKRIRNILLIMVRSLIVLFFILSATHYSCGVLRKGDVILIDTSYSTTADDLFKEELKVANEIFSRVSSLRIFECSDDIFEVSPETLIKGKIKPSIRSGSLTRCLQRLKDEGYRSVLVISDGRKEGWREEEILKLSREIEINYIDVSGGRVYGNAWVEDVKNGVAIIRGNGDFDVKWSLQTDTFSMKGKIRLKDGRGEVTFPSSTLSYGVIRIEDDALTIDNSRYFVAEGGTQTVLVFDYFPSEVKYYDEAYYVRNALSKLKDVKVETVTGNNKVELDDVRFIFILNPPQGDGVINLLRTALKRRIPVFISGGDNGGFERLVGEVGFTVKGIKELGGAERELAFNNSFADIYPYSDVRDTIRIEKLFVSEWREDFPPILYLTTGEPILVKKPDYPLFILLTTADTEWSHLPLSRLFLPLLADIVLNATGGFYEETTPFISSGEKLTQIMGERWEFEELPPGIYERENGKGKLVNNFIPSDESFLTPAKFPSTEGVTVSGGRAFELWKLLLLSLLFLFPLEGFLSR